ncbi:hypothetical protein HYQ45_012623 [Verticillium longisporum]|uniref:FR47-like domain-containing protein n=1 Tax=Verticillium longisporum TaxID=100787 RepID=A0A8I2ZED0_VERLO|nr:hypothetical protein HYQ45_012623 [Verticillium longisporum]
MTRSVPAQTFSEVPDGILDLLILHLPYSLSLVRRLQYTAASPTGKTPSARIVVASDSPPAEPTRHDAGFDVTARHFTVSYFDPSRGPETQTWIYSTLEDAHARDSSVVLAQDETAHCEKQIMAVVSEVKCIAREYDAVEPLAFPRQVIVGTLHHAVRAVMRKHDVSLTHRHDYQKIIFPFDKLPSADAALPAGLSFETTTLEDCHIVKSRTDIPRKVRDARRMGLFSLHCEEQHRRKGLACAVAAKVMRERTRLFGSEPWSSSEVAPTNVSSHAMCKSLNGEIKWDVSWTLLGIEENGS